MFRKVKKKLFNFIKNMLLYKPTKEDIEFNNWFYIQLKDDT